MTKFIRNFRLLVMPQLSPSMKSGIVTKIHIKPMQFIKSYDLIMNIATQTLLDNSSSKKQTTNNINIKDGNEFINNDLIEMQIELLEDMYIAKLLINEGSTLDVGSPIALLFDSLEDIKYIDMIKIPEQFNAYNNTYQNDQYNTDNKNNIPSIAMWQAYTTTSSNCNTCS